MSSRKAKKVDPATAEKDAKTKRLKKARLAKEASDKKNPAPKKVAKAPAKKPAKNAAAKGRPSRLADNAVIKVLVAKNPKRPESAAGKRFDLYKKGMTVGQFLAAGGWQADVRWDVKQGFVELIQKPAA